MKKIILIVVLLFSVILTGTVLAREPQEPVPLAPEIALPELPNPGLVPGDFFYFLDMWGEGIGEFFTFQAEARAILQAERALERIAEVKALLEREGVDAPGLAVAEEGIQRNMKRANEILEEQRAAGIEVATLAARLERDFDVRQDLLESVFETKEAYLNVRKKEIRLAIKEARAINDFEELAKSRAVLGDIRARKERLDVRQDGLMVALDIEEERLELKMEIAERELDILEDEMESLFDKREREMEKKFERKERDLEAREEVLEIQLKEMVLVGDMPAIEEIKTKIIDLEIQEKIIEQEQEALEIILEQREDEERGIIDMRERALEQIKDAREEIFDIKEEITEMMIDGIIVETPVAVLELLTKADEKLSIAEQAFEEGNYGKAFGQAMAAEKLAMNAERILEEKEEIEVEDKRIVVTLPTPNQVIINPVQVSGKSNTFEANVRIRIKDDNNKVLADTFTTGGHMGILGPFSKDVFYIKPSAPRGVIEVFEDCAKTGKEINKVSVSITFGPHKKVDLRVTSPDGGERWTLGGTYYITWESEGIRFVDIELIGKVQGRRRVWSLTGDVGLPAGKGKHRWMIPKDLPLGDNYQIQIRSRAERPPRPVIRVADISDNYFSIVAKEIFEKAQLTNEVALALIGIEECDLEGAPGYYASCIMDISKEKDYWVVTITHDGLFDDSVRAIRLRAIVMHKDGQWVKGEISKTHKCWPGRGHQYFSTKLCI